MSKGGRKQTQTTQVDPATAAYVQQVRNMALGFNGMPGAQQPQAPQRGGIPGVLDMARGMLPGHALMPNNPMATNGGGGLFGSPAEMAAQYMNPYQQQVIDATRGEFDQLRGQASMATDQAATMAGAFGGSRHGVAEGARLGEIDRAQGSQIAGLLNSGYNNALQFGQNRQQMGMNFLNLGMGIPGQSSVTQGGGPSRLGQAAGGAMTGASIGSIIPGVGTGIGAAIGGGLGLLGIL